MSNVVKWLVGAVLLGALCVLGIGLNLFNAGAQRAENRLQAAAETALASLSRSELAVRMEGQHAVVTGVVPHPEEVESVRRAVRSAHSFLGVGAGGGLWGGVRSVDVAGLEVRRPRTAPYVWSADRDGNALRIAGLIPSTADRELLLARARAMFGDDVRIEDAMRIDPEAPHPHWTYLSALGLDALARLTKGGARLQGLGLQLDGEAADASARDAARRILRSADQAFELEGEVAQARGTITLAAPPRRVITPPTPTPTPEPTPTPTPTPAEPPASVEAATPIDDGPADDAPAPPPTPERLAEQAAEADACQTAFDSALTDQTIQFESDSATLRLDSLPLLDDLAVIAAACPDAELRIAGHTDSTGDAARNDVLSRDRALAVVAYLNAQGVRLERLEAEGFGARRPVGDNQTANGRALNRRIEITVSR